MIVFGRAFTYSVQGRKVDELFKFIRDNIEFTHLNEGEDISAVIKMLEDKVDELNKKYPKTVKYYPRLVDDCYLRISLAGNPMKGIAINVLTVRPFMKGGEA